MKMKQSVPKRRYINFRRRVITQKKSDNIQNKEKAWNQGCIFLALGVLYYDNKLYYFDGKISIIKIVYFVIIVQYSKG